VLHLSHQIAYQLAYFTAACLACTWQPYPQAARAKLPPLMQHLGTGAASRARAPRYITHRPHAALSPNWTPFSASVVEMPVVQGRWLTLA